MAVQTPKTCSLLFVILISIVLLIVSSGYLSKSISWTAFSGKNKHEGAATLFENDITFWEKKGNSTPPPAVFNTTHTAKIAESTKTNLVTKTKTDQIKTSMPLHGGETETPMPVLYKKSFSRLPQWDFEDVYNQDALPKQMTCAESLRNSKDESFKKAFLPNIRLYLHKDNFNMSEWNRLSHFNNPFGFMEYKYDEDRRNLPGGNRVSLIPNLHYGNQISYLQYMTEVMASVKLIPKPKEPLLLPKPGSGGCVRCAVVGTAGILNGSKMGKVIDSHDYVFRMNGAVMKGYEEDVGNKTSVYVHTAHSITSSVYYFKKYGYKSVPNDEGIKFVLIPEGMRDFNWLQGLLKGERISSGAYLHERPRKYYAEQYNETRFYVLHPDFLRYVRNRFLKSESLNASFWAIVRPTNGAFTVFLALHTCDTVNAYGFMTEDYKKYSNYYFERDVKTNVIFYMNHDYILEMNAWKKLDNSKILKLYQRTDSKEEKEPPQPI